MPRKDEARETAVECARIAEGKKGTDIVVLDIRKIAFITDYFVVVSGNNSKQLQAIADEISSTLKGRGRKRIGMEGYDAGAWILVDFSDVVIHLFHEEMRRYYELENLWSDGKKVRWQMKAEAVEE
ncbi:MAG: ribosome silencing factor [Planctomycetes bacterium]|nr:ribosome silencing factor [Planctomycetota bacterium]